ncbi:MAG: hypothetical protein D6772_17045 [Bacteroidetes bacterium]|nr:MAG: hypothetical protein D6772_17045 [Bacteroidota bacterium]
MERIERLREQIYNRKLQRLRVATDSRITHLAQARSVAICFPAQNVTERKQALAYADRLRKAGKRIKLLAFIPVVDKEATFAFDYFTKKDIGFGRYPKGPVIDKFLSKAYDAFICLFPHTNPQIEFLSAAVRAKLQIGPRPERAVANFDIMIDAPANYQIADFIRYYEEIFAKSSQAVLEASKV